jgi:hypothetical protein
VRTKVLAAAAANAAWITAAMRGVVGVERALDVLQGLRVSPRVRQEGTDEIDGLAIAMHRWRQRGITGWRYVPAAPADAAGVPGPPALRSTVIEQGAALVSVDGHPCALVPSLELCSPDDYGSHLLLLELEADGHGLVSFDTVSEADRALLEALHDAVDALDGLDVAQWRDDATDLRRGWRDTPVLPPGATDRATRLAGRSLRVLETLDIAMTDPGGSRTAHEMGARASTLAQVAATARSAHAAAWNGALNEADRRR